MSYDKTVNTVSATCSADNIFTDPIWVPGGEEFALQMTGGAGSTITIQRGYSSLNTGWVDVNSYTAFGVYTDIEPVGAWFRAGTKSGGYSTNAVAVRIDRGCV